MLGVTKTLVVVLNAHNQAIFPRALLLWHHMIIMSPHLHHMRMQPPLHHLQPNLLRLSTQPNLHRQRMQPTLQQDLQPQHLHNSTQVFSLQPGDQRQQDAPCVYFSPNSGKMTTIR